MKNDIDELNLIYGVTIYKIMLKYSEFNTQTKKDRKNIYNTLNEFFISLEKNKHINSNNVVKIGLLLLENADIKEKILLNQINELPTIVDNIVKKMNCKKIENCLMKNNNNELYVPFIYNGTEEKLTFHEIADNILSTNDLIYSDLIQLFISNYDFPKKVESHSSYNYCANILNSLNILFYQLNELLHTNRNDLYYCSLLVINYRYAQGIIFPRVMYPTFNFESKSREIADRINTIIARAFHFLNRYYYISVPSFSYNNSGKSLSKMGDINKEKELVSILLKGLNTEQKILLLKIGSNLNEIERDYSLTKVEFEEINNIIEVFKKNKDIDVSSQSTEDKYKYLIEQNSMGIVEYCQNQRLLIKDFIYNPDFDTANIKIFIEFSIYFNDFNYKFSLRKFNNTFSWNVKLKGEKTYRINLHLEDDYRHIIQAMIDD